MRLAFTNPGLRRGLNDCLAVAAAELRSARRLARTWVFIGLGLAVIGTAYGYYSNLHSSVSTGFLSAGELLPRFATAYFKSYVLWFFMAAIVFLAFDLRSRDERERISEVLDARAVSNLPVVGGRLAAIVFVVATALFGAILLIQTVGTVGRALGWSVDPLEPVATFTYFFVDAIPALILWSAVVGFLAVGLRNRLATAVAALALLGLHMWSFALTPAYLLPAVSLLHIYDNLASDLAPRFATAQIYLQRGSLLLFAGALVVWTAALHQRSDGRSSGKRLRSGILLAATGAVGMGTVAFRCVEDVRVREAWLASHQDIPTMGWPAVEHIHGAVVIDPGRVLELDIGMRLFAPADLDRFAFSFNPGLAIEEVRLDHTEVPFTHRDGLLIVEPPQGLAKDSKTTLALVASGIPEANFAYLDGAVDWRRESSRNGILWLGTAGGIFDERYVALMPGLRWLPVPGPNLEGISHAHFPTVDLTVTAPDGWLVAGPGLRHRQDDGSYRFHPAAPVPEVGLFASRFERHAIGVAGVELELLLHPDHQRTLAHFANVGELIESRLQRIFEEAAEMGIPYPYNAFSVVEVPTYLRIYRGGSRLDTAMALPGMLLLREHGFPYSDMGRFDTIPMGFPGGAEALKVQRLESLFRTFIDPGSASRALARNLVGFQTAADGPGAQALDYVCEELGVEIFNTASSRAINPTIYTAHSSSADASFGSTVTQMVRGLRNQFQSETRRGFVVGQYLEPAMWERAASTSLVELDLESNPRQAIRAFGLRARAAVLAIFEGMGRSRTAAFLAELRRRHAGGTFDNRDFNAAASAIGVDLPGLIGDWLNETALPGFITSRATVVRIADDAEGRPRYETRFHVKNGEPVPGLVRVSHRQFFWDAPGDPIRIPGNAAVEVGIVTPRPPERLWLEPYLAMNRLPVRIELDRIETSEDSPREPLVGSQPSAWSPASEGVVIDDLDPGFRVEDRAEDARRRIGAALVGLGRQREYDQGLPVATQRAGEWSRATIATGWGKYRHTVAGSIPGDGSAVAVFVAELPEPGRWRLEYHVPDRHGLGLWGPSYGALGTLGMTVIADGREMEIAYDGASAGVGWNEVGKFEFVSTNVRLEVSNRTDGEMVVADAVRWIPLD